MLAFLRRWADRLTGKPAPQVPAQPQEGRAEAPPPAAKRPLPRVSRGFSPANDV